MLLVLYFKAIRLDIFIRPSVPYSAAGKAEIPTQALVDNQYDLLEARPVDTLLRSR